MLEHLPAAMGKALHGIRPGLDKLVANRHFAETPATIVVTSPAFAEGDLIPREFTQDGRKASPPLAWSGVPAGTREVVVLIEDADSPTPDPLVHAIVIGLPGRDGSLSEAEIGGATASGTPHRLGRTSFLKAEYLPPDPPPGHGPHRYAVQVFALDEPLALAPEPGRGALLAVMRGHVVAKGVLTGTYERP